MRIAFDEVSFSYDPAAARSTRRSRAHGNRAAARSGVKWGSGPFPHWALSRVSVDVASGEMLGIAGHTGSGKSTFAQLAAGLEQPTRGRVLVDGSDLSDRRAVRALRGRIGVALQYPERQLFARSVAEDVAFGPRNLGISGDELDVRVRDALSRVGLGGGDVAAASPFDLSGGQQRRVALAGVLAMEPEALILDEPAAGLDPRARATMLDLVSQLHAEGLTVLMVSHNMEDLARLCDRILVLNAGEMHALGAPEEVFRDPAPLRAVGLGAPAYQETACRLRDRGVALDRDLYDLDALVDDLVAAWHGHAGAPADEPTANVEGRG